jgi:uncharacterized Ntn-hydrolase superfamily protein
VKQLDVKLRQLGVVKTTGREVETTGREVKTTGRG